MEGDRNAKIEKRTYMITGRCLKSIQNQRRDVWRDTKRCTEQRKNTEKWERKEGKDNTWLEAAGKPSQTKKGHKGKGEMKERNKHYNYKGKEWKWIERKGNTNTFKDA